MGQDVAVQSLPMARRAHPTIDRSVLRCSRSSDSILFLVNGKVASPKRMVSSAPKPPRPSPEPSSEPC